MIARISKYAIKNIFRNTFLSISSILILTLLMFFINILLVVHSISFKLIESINEKLSISLYLDDDYTKNDKEVVDLIDAVKRVNWAIDVYYKDKDDVLEELRRNDPKLVSILERTNPLPATIELSWISIQDYDKVDYIIQSKIFLLLEWNRDVNDDDWGEHFSDYSIQYEKISSVTNMLEKLQLILYLIIGTFLFSIGIIVYSIIWNFIYYYRDEIYITRLVGWSKLFIYWPFSLQGILYSWVAFLLSVWILIIFLKNANLFLQWNYSLTFLFWTPWLLFLFEGIVCVFIGWISGLISSRKYLK